MDDSARIAAELLLKRQKSYLVGADAAKSVLNGLTAKQYAFVTDQATRQIAVTGRQSGKTESCARKLVRRALSKRGAKALYIGTTRQNAYDVMWHRLQSRLETSGIQYETNGTRLEVRVNDSLIKLTGVNHKQLADRIRGNEYDEVVIDEAAVYPSELLRYLVEDVLEQTLLVRRGVLSLISTPGLLQSGWFYDRCMGKGAWSRHKWTMHDNPALGDIQAYLEQKLADNGWTINEPIFRREYLGEWCQDTNSGVYRVGPGNIIAALPDGPYHSILGVDLGYNDEAAFCVLSWRDNDPRLYVQYADGAPELDVTAIAGRIKELRDAFRPTQIICDAGALGKTIVAELTVRHGLAIEAADKRDKPAMVRLVNSDLLRGSLVMTPGRLYDQMANLRWHPDYIGLKEQDGIPNDLCDAMLYAFKVCWHHVQKIREPQPVVNSSEWLNKQAEEAKKQLQIRLTNPDPYREMAWEDVNPWDI